MGIDGIGPINNYNNYNKKINKTRNVDKTEKTDSVSISQEAMANLETSKIRDILNSTPDVRADKIASVKEKLKDPNYLNNAIENGLADSIMDLFNI